MEFSYNSNNVDSNTILYNAQLITSAFAKTLEENNCLLMLTIGLHQEIVNSTKDLEDLSDNASETNDALDSTASSSSSVTSDDVLNTISSIAEDLKSSCFSCNLKLPSLDFDMDLSGVMASLTAQLNLYKSIFQNRCI